MKRIVVIAAASLMIGASGMVGCKKEETPQADNRTAGEKTADAVDKAGKAVGDATGKAVDATDNAAKTVAKKVEAATQPSADTAVKDTRDTLAAATDAAVSHDGLNDVVDQFTKVARDRIGKIDKNTLGDLNAAIDKFRADWKAKYGQDFKVSDKEQVVFVAPVQIQVGNATGTAAPAESNGQSSNNVTTVVFPAAGGAASVTVGLVNEGTVRKLYRLAVADSLDANKLRDNLVKHINEVDSMKDRWPADVNEATRLVSHHIFDAITDPR